MASDDTLKPPNPDLNVIAILAQLGIPKEKFERLSMEAKNALTKGFKTLQNINQAGGEIEIGDTNTLETIAELTDMVKQNLASIKSRFHGGNEWMNQSITYMIHAANESNPAQQESYKRGAESAAQSYVNSLKNAGKDYDESYALKLSEVNEKATPYLTSRFEKMHTLHTGINSLHKDLSAIPLPETPVKA